MWHWVFVTATYLAVLNTAHMALLLIAGNLHCILQYVGTRVQPVQYLTQTPSQNRERERERALVERDGELGDIQNEERSESNRRSNLLS
jgi:hypothetical protein